MDLHSLRKAIDKRQIIWNKHSFERMLERGISRKDGLDVIAKGKVIEDYLDDKPYPSALILGKPGKNALHVVVAFDINNDLCYIITAYYPNDKYFENDFKTRKKK